MEIKEIKDELYKLAGAEKSAAKSMMDLLLNMQIFLRP